MPRATVEAIYRELIHLKREIAELKHRVNEDYVLSDWARERISGYEAGDVETVPHGEIKEKFA